MPLSLLNYAKSKLLSGEFDMATAYYNRARSEGVPECIVNLRYVTKEYLVYPLEYENSCNYFELLRQLHALAANNPQYIGEYQTALFFRYFGNACGFCGRAGTSAAAPFYQCK